MTLTDPGSHERAVIAPETPARGEPHAAGPRARQAPPAPGRGREQRAPSGSPRARRPDGRARSGPRDAGGSGGRGPSGRGRPPGPPPPPPHVVRARRVALARASFFLAASLIAPGSVQFAVGNRRFGQVALAVWAAMLAAGGGLLWLGTRRPDMVATLATSGAFLGLLRLVVVVVVLGWLVVIVDAWRLARPLELARGPRLAMTGALLGLLALVSVVGLNVFQSVGAQKDLVATMFAGRPAIGSVDGRYNVLLIGGDAGSDREGLRPDSLTVASIDADTGRTVLIGIPRNLQEAPFPEGSPLRTEWPEGYSCGDECTINTLYTWASSNPDLLPDAEDPGLEATRQAVEGVTDLTIPFTVIVDMAGFEQLVDALGGVSMNVGKRVPIGGGAAPVEGYIEPGVQRLDGFEALWFARGREGSSDYERVVRQKCVMSALARQVDPATAVRNFSELAAASAAMIRTDIPTGDVPGLLAVATKARNQPIDSISLVPPLVNPTWPEFEQIHGLIHRALAGQPVVDPVTSPEGDGSVGNSGSSAEAALIGSVPAPSQGGTEAGEPRRGGGAGKRNGSGEDGSSETVPFICAPA